MTSADVSIKGASLSLNRSGLGIGIEKVNIAKDKNSPIRLYSPKVQLVISLMKIIKNFRLELDAIQVKDLEIRVLEKNTTAKKITFSQLSISTNFRNKGLLFNGLIKKTEDPKSVVSFSGDIEGDLFSDHNGSLLLDSKDSVLDLSFFSLPLITPRLISAKIEWEKSVDRIDIKSSKLKYVDQNFDISGGFYFIKDTSLREETLHTNFLIHHGKLAHLMNYIPNSLVSRKLFSWLNNAKIKGVINGGKIETHTDKKRNLVDIKIPVAKASIKFAPDWPTITDADLIASFTNEELDIKILKGDSLGVTIDAGSKVSSNNILKDDIDILLDLNLKSSFSDAKNYITHSPLKEDLTNFLKAFELKGNNSIKLKCTIPIAGYDRKPKYTGTIYSKKAKIIYKDTPNLRLEEINGSFYFDEEKQLIKEIKALFFNKPINLTMSHDTSHNQSYKFFLDGVVSSNLLYTLHPNIPPNRISGEAKIRSEISIDIGEDGIQSAMAHLSSDLKGVMIDIPNLLKKDRAKSLPLKSSLSYNLKSITAKVNFHKKLFTSFTLEKEKKYILSKGYITSSKKSAIAKEGSFTIDIPRAKGVISIPKKKSKTHKIVFQSLDIDLKDKNYTKNKEARYSNSKQLNFKFDDLPFSKVIFTIKSLKLNNLEINDLNGTLTKEDNSLLISNFSTKTKESSLVIKKMLWTKEEEKEECLIVGKLTSKNFAKLADQVDISNSIKGFRGFIRFNISWLGNPLSITSNNRKGKVYIKFKDGLINDANKLVTRLLNILTLNIYRSIKKDLKINKIEGPISITNEHFSYNKLNLNFPGSKIEATGKLELEKEIIDTKISIVFSFSNLIKVGVLVAANPLLGGIYWLTGNMEDTSFIDQYAKQKFDITGTISNPKIKKK